MKFDPIDKTMLLAYIDGELDPGDQARIEAQLDTDMALRVELEKLRRLRDNIKTTLSETDTLSVPETRMWERLQQRIVRREQTPDTTKDHRSDERNRGGTTLFSAVATALLILLLSICPPATFSNTVLMRSNNQHAVTDDLRPGTYPDKIFFVTLKDRYNEKHAFLLIVITDRPPGDRYEVPEPGVQPPRPSTPGHHPHTCMPFWSS
jgi:hypothetical protein